MTEDESKSLCESTDGILCSGKGKCVSGAVPEHILGVKKHNGELSIVIFFSFEISYG